MNRLIKLAFPLLLVTACSAQQSISSNYDFQDVSFPNSFYSVPLGINNLRQVAGTYIDATGEHGFLWDAGVFTTIDYPGGFGTSAGGINDKGEVVGLFVDALGFQHGYKMTPNVCGDGNNGVCKSKFTPIDVPGAAQTQSVPFEFGPGLGTAAVGINNYGQVTGMYATPGLYSNGFVNVGQTFTPIDHPLAGHGPALGTKCFSIANNGVLACDYLVQATPTSYPMTHAFLVNGAHKVAIDCPGAAQYFFGTQISGVNIHYTAVGTCFNGYSLDAILWSDGKFYTVNVAGMPYNELHSINDRGDVTGAYDTDPSGQQLFGFVAFLKP